MAAAALIVIPVVCLGMKKKIRSLLIAIAMMFFTVLLCFPAVFTAQRIIPAVTAQPETMIIEELPSEIQHGRDLAARWHRLPHRSPAALLRQTGLLPSARQLRFLARFSMGEIWIPIII